MGEVGKEYMCAACEDEYDTHCCVCDQGFCGSCSTRVELGDSFLGLPDLDENICNGCMELPESKKAIGAYRLSGAFGAKIRRELKSQAAMLNEVADRAFDEWQKAAAKRVTRRKVAKVSD